MASFQQLVEHITARYVQNGFVEGDFVKFTSNVMTQDGVKQRPQSYRDRIMSLIDSDKPIRITALKPVRYNTGPAATDEWLADVALQTAPGLSAEVITVPTEVLELATPHDQWPGVPASIVHDYNNSNNVPPAPDQTLSSHANRQLKHAAPR